VSIFGLAAPPHIARAGAVFMFIAAGMVALPVNPGHADSLIVGGCVGPWWGTQNCVTRKSSAGDPYVRLVPAPVDEAEKARAGERDRRWMDHCRPVIAQDRYGVPRYRYVADGCQFGVIE
jgi:hypothetical protein